MHKKQYRSEIVWKSTAANARCSTLSLVYSAHLFGVKCTMRTISGYAQTTNNSHTMAQPHITAQAEKTRRLGERKYWTMANF